MIIPKFKERTLPVFDMERYINEEASDEEKQLKRILEAITELDHFPTVAEMTALLEYESQALDYCFNLAITTLDKRGFEKDLTDIHKAVNNENFYNKCLKHDILFAKYCTLQQVLNEMLVIRSIKDKVREIAFKYNYYDREMLQAVTSLKNEWVNFNILPFIILF